MAKRTSPWGGSYSHKIKTNKPKNVAEAANNRLMAIEAIDRGMCLSLTYEGLPRVVEVHTVGTTTAFRPAMSAWQVDGESNTPPIPAWRLFSFDECFNITLTSTPSEGPRTGFRNRAKQFRKIDREI
jgi:hypothetical protein